MSLGPYSQLGKIMVFAPLYAGPVLAGLSGAWLGWVPVFAAFFLLFIAMTRKPDLHQPAGWATLAGMAVMQVVLAAVAFGVGLLGQSVIGALDVPIWLPLALTAIAAIYGALSYTGTAEMDVFLDGAIEKLRALDGDIVADWTQVHPEVPPRITAPIETALDEARGLEPPVYPGEVEPLAARLERDLGAEAFDALYDAAGNDAGRGQTAVDFLLLRFLKSPAMRRELIARGEAGMGAMLLLNSPHAEVRAEAIARLRELFEAGAPHDQLPDPMWLGELQAEYPGEGFGDLRKIRDDLSKGGKTR